MNKKIFPLLLAIVLILPLTVSAKEIIGEETEISFATTVKKYYKHLVPKAGGAPTVTFELNENEFEAQVDSIRNGLSTNATVAYEGIYEDLTLSYTLVNSSTNTYDVTATSEWVVLPSRRDYDFMFITFSGNNITATNYYQTQQYKVNGTTYAKDTRYNTTDDYLEHLGINRIQRSGGGNTGSITSRGALFDLYTGTAQSIKTTFSTRINGLNVNKKLCAVHKHKTSSSSLPLAQTGIYLNDNPGGRTHLVTMGLSGQSYNQYDSMFSTSYACFHMYDE